MVVELAGEMQADLWAWTRDELVAEILVLRAQLAGRDHVLSIVRAMADDELSVACGSVSPRPA